MLRITAAALLLSATSAMAWETTVEGPDVFGVTKALGGTSNGREFMVVQCNSDGDLYLALISPKKEFEDVPEIPATFLIQIDSETPHKLDATLRAWNDKNAGIVASGRSDDVVSALKAIGTAKRNVNVGFEVAGMRESATFGARGSTKAVETIIKSCTID